MLVVLVACSVFNLFVFPLGTALGAYSLWVLFDERTKLLFVADLSA